MAPGLDDVKRRRRRVLVMSAIAALLFVASAFVHLVLLREPDGSINVSAADFNTTLDLGQVDSVGEMMHARVLGWADLSTLERIEKVGHLGRLAAAEGVEEVRIVVASVF